jgi:hypothetical protein
MAEDDDEDDDEDEDVDEVSMRAQSHCRSLFRDSMLTLFIQEPEAGMSNAPQHLTWFIATNRWQLTKTTWRRSTSTMSSAAALAAR